MQTEIGDLNAEAIVIGTGAEEDMAVVVIATIVHQGGTASCLMIAEEAEDEEEIENHIRNATAAPALQRNQRNQHQTSRMLYLS